MGQCESLVGKTCKDARIVCDCQYLCGFNTTQVLCWHAPVIQALHETAELIRISDAHTEQNVSLLTS